MWRCLRRQHELTPRCPETPDCSGQLALVTGGGRGIGLETTRGLARRGASVLCASRRDPGAEVPARFVALDLSDLSSVRRGLEALQRALDGRALDIVVANAGLWPTTHRLSAQGHEIAFATNVLGHHALIRGLQHTGLLAERARVVMVTGDIYVMASDCTPDFHYRGAYGGQLAYCRSKLGNLWLVRELAHRHPALHVFAAHPGVIASELAGSSRGLVGALKSAIMLPVEAGAQTSLYCATQPDLPTGSYFHNTMGRVELRLDDPGADAEKSAQLWTLLEQLSADVTAGGRASPAGG